MTKEPAKPETKAAPKAPKPSFPQPYGTKAQSHKGNKVQARYQAKPNHKGR